MPTPTTAPHRKRQRTDQPGVYRRGGSFSVVVARGKRQVWRQFATMDEALAFKEAEQAKRNQRIREIIAAKRRAHARDAADLTDAYAEVRRAAQTVDRARRGGSSLRNEILQHLHAAEDAIALAIKRT